MNISQQSAETNARTIRVVLDSGIVVKLTKEQAQASRFIGYQCTNCHQMTTVAEGRCGNCGSSFEPRDSRELETVQTVDGFKEENWDRLVFLLTHQGWVCSYCRCSNTNYPREGGHDGVKCIHCGNNFTEGKDILIPDGDIVSAGGGRSVESLKQKIRTRFGRTRGTPGIGTTLFTAMDGGNTRGMTSTSESDSTSILKHKWKILTSIFGSGLLAWALYYGFIQEHDIQVTVDSQKWERQIDIEKYLPQRGEGWQEQTNPTSYDHFEIIETTMKEAPWDSYEVQTGTRNVTDSSVCLRIEKTCQKTEVTLSNGATVPGPESCSTSCAEHGTKTEPVMETRYHPHPYVYFRYMGWEVAETLKTSGQGTNVYWADTTKYSFDNTTTRMGSHRQNYTIDISGSERQKETVQNLPYETWKTLRPGTDCHATATRWGGMQSSKINWTNDCQK